MKLIWFVAGCVALGACGSQGNAPAGTDETSSSTTGTVDPSTSTAAQTTEVDTTTTSDPDSSSSTSEANDDGPPPEPLVMTLIDEAIYYDGYAETVDEPIPRGLIRHSNAQYAVPVTAEQRELLQETLIVGVIVGARCDNYDRIGSVNLALVPKGAETYAPGDVERIEVARFITPFMDMNDDPKTVPYEFQADNVLALLKDEALWAEYDPWFELYIFGVPYAANTEVAGCADRNDTQAGTLLLYTDSNGTAPVFDTLIPVAINQPFNDYAEGASDEIGLTRKTISFDLPADAEEAQLVLITSNHGANQGGEEYIRRDHFVYLDQELVLEYRPGRDTCEPFRVYNTQANGIYGPSPRSDAEWQSFSNWCPGDVIDTRIIPFGPATAGAHEFVIDVPDATFADDQGDFPFSLYVQARTGE
jgi:hypothetical protein